jgi:uncharacterized membrane protein
VKRSSHMRAARRLAIVGAIGLAAIAGALLGGAEWAVAFTGGWSVTALVLVAWIWVEVGRMSPEETKARARTEDLSRTAADLVFLSASIASLVAVGYTLVYAGRHHGTDKALLIALAFASVALSWACVHTIYALRYGDLYYADPPGGIDFNEDDRPDYRDFAYLALTIGMTYQVSDTALGTKTLRRTAIRHALLSYLFGAVIVAVAINAVASLLH